MFLPELLNQLCAASLAASCITCRFLSPPDLSQRQPTPSCRNTAHLSLSRRTRTGQETQQFQKQGYLEAGCRQQPISRYCFIKTTPAVLEALPGAGRAVHTGHRLLAPAGEQPLPHCSCNLWGRAVPGSNLDGFCF